MIRTEKRPASPRRPQTLLAVDPGLRDLGAAFFEDGELVDFDLVVNPESSARDALAWCAMQAEVARRFRCPNEFAAEFMVVRKTRRDVRPDDLLQLCGVVGVLVGHYAAAESVVYRPEHWKGSVKKRVHQPRILAALNPSERASVDAWLAAHVDPYNSIDEYVEMCRRRRGDEIPPGTAHNVVDAIGIGLAHLGRIKGVRR